MLMICLSRARNNSSNPVGECFLGRIARPPPRLEDEATTAANLNTRPHIPQENRPKHPKICKSEFLPATAQPTDSAISSPRYCDSVRSASSDQNIAPLISHGSASSSVVRSSVSARGSIRNCDELDSLVAEAQLVASLIVPVDFSGGTFDRHQDPLGPDPGRLRGRIRNAMGRH